MGRVPLFEDGSEQEVDAIVWATGYRSDFSWIDIPAIKDERGGCHPSAVTDAPVCSSSGSPGSTLGGQHSSASQARMLPSSQVA